MDTTTAVFLNEEALGQHLAQKHFSLHTEHYGFTALVPAFLDMLQGGNIGKTIADVARRGSERLGLYTVYIIGILYT